jgi:hypothetical protein
VGQRVGNDPYGAAHGKVDSIAGPVEMVVGTGKKLGHPDEDFETDDLGREQACG